MFTGKIRINTVQIFGFKIDIEKKTPDSELNIKHIIDSFKSERKEESNIDLRINYILLRNGNISYDVISEDTIYGQFDPNHIFFDNIKANISLKTFNSDSIYASVKRLSFNEKSRFEIKRSDAELIVNKNNLKINNFHLDFGSSTFFAESIKINDPKGNLVKFKFASPLLKTIVNNSKINITDLSYFYPALKDIDKYISLETDINADLSNLNIEELKISSNSDLNILIQSKFTKEKIEMQIKDFYIGSKMIYSIPILKSMIDNGKMNNIDFIKGQCSLSGKYSDIKSNVTIKSSVGNILSSFRLALKENKFPLFRGNISVDKLLLEKVFPKAGLGELSMNINVTAPKTKKVIYMDINGNIETLTYKGYKYDNIIIDGTIDNNTYSGFLELNDDNAYLKIDGLYNNKNVPLAQLKINAQNIDLFTIGLIKNQQFENSNLSMTLNANAEGSNIDNFKGRIIIDSISFYGKNGIYNNGNIIIDAHNISDKEKSLSIKSNFIDAEVRGQYSYTNIVKSFMNIAKHYMPILESEQDFSKKKQKNKSNFNNFTFSAKIENSEILNKVFMVPVILNKKAIINGYFNDELKRFRVEASVPKVKLKNKIFESSLFTFETTSNDSLKLLCRSNILIKEDNTINISLHSILGNNDITSELFFGNNKKITYSGNINNQIKLDKNKDGKIKAVINFNKSHIILKDSLWNLQPTTIVIDSGKINIDKFRIENNDKFIDIKGIISNNVSDSIFVNLNSIDLGYVFELANIKRVVDFSGLVTGKAYANGVLNIPRINAELYVDNFRFNKSRLGDMNVSAIWNNKNKGIYIDARIIDSDRSKTDVNGTIFPVKPGSIDLSIKTSHVDLGFLRHYMKAISSDVDGRASGNIRIHGPFQNGINLTGWAVAENFKFKIDLLNTYLYSSDTVKFLPDKIFMDKISVNDGLGHSGYATVSLPHNHLKDLTFNVQASLNNMLIMNTKESLDLPFYGTVFGTGTLYLNGGSGKINVNADMKTEPNSSFSFILNNTSIATNNQFVSFVDKTKYWRSDTLNTYKKTSIQKKQETPSTDVRLKLNIEATPGAYIKLIMDKNSGDYIGGTGNGNINVDFYNKGDIKMYGNYTLDQGVYKFSLQEVIRKDFVIKSGSNITFNGNPLNALLDINASYSVNSVSLQDLGQDVVDQAGQSNVKVNCTMNLSGDLVKPDIKLGLELPNEGEEVERTVLNAISTEEQMNMQILYLLGIGKFYVQNYNTGMQSSNAISSVLSSTISGQLNNMFSNLIDNNNLNIGTNFSTGSDGWTDVEFEGMLSGQLLNNRLLINGNLGYRDNALSQSNFIGDFEVEYLLNKTGNFRIKAYTKTNDRYYTKTTLTTQGIGFVFKRDFNNWKDLFGFENRLLKKKKIKEKDSIINNH